MKPILFVVFALFIFSCSTNNKNSKENPEQEYVMVDARVRVNHKDGTRTYNEYKPFKTVQLKT